MNKWLKALFACGFAAACSLHVSAAESVVESARAIPLLREVDVLVVGGTAGGVAAAAAAADAGASVYLAGGFPYLGEDLAATLELGLDGADAPASELTKAFWHLRSGLAPYKYKAKMDQDGTWTYKNDFSFKLAESSDPRTARDTMRHTTDTSVECTLVRASEVSRIEAVAFDMKDGRTSAVSAEILDGALKGRVYALGRVRDIDVDGDYKAGRAKATVFAADVGGTFQRARLVFEKDPGRTCQYISRIRFPLANPGAFTEPPTPMKVKRDLDDALIGRKIPFITSSPLTDLLVDAKGNVAGGVIANRSGRQAIRARVVVDATMQGSATRLAQETGLSGDVGFTRVISSAERPKASGHVAVEPVEGVEGLWRLGYSLPVGKGSPRDLLKLASESDRITWAGEPWDQADVALARGVRAPEPRKFVMRVPSDGPIEGRLAAAAEIGRQAAKDAQSRPKMQKVRVEGSSADGGAEGDVRELLGGFRAWEDRPNETVPSPARSLPVFAEADVVVAGLGTSGAAAAIGAARGGARTIGVEFGYVPGGVGTEGLIAAYYDGNHCGFTAEFNKRCKASGMRLNVNRRIVAWRGLMSEAGVEAWYGCMGEGAWTDKSGRVRGVVVVTPYGRGVVLAKTVIDATGNSDIAVAAGAEASFGGPREFALQSAGQAPLRLGHGGANSDFGYVNDSDALDVWLFSLKARQGALDAWDMSQIVDSRERRRIVPDYAMQGWDVDAHRRFPDTIVQSRSRHDSHGYLVDDYWYVQERKNNGVPRDLNVPFRSLLPKGVSNLAVVGLGAGVARDVMPMVRMQADLMNMGYAVGLAAAQAAETTDGDYRRIDFPKLRKRLVDDGVLRKEVLGWNADPEPSDDELAAAAETLKDGYKGAGVLWRAPERAKPYLLKAYAAASDSKAKLPYAKTLGLWGDGTGSREVAIAFKGSPRDVGLAKALGRGRGPHAKRVLLSVLESIKATGDLNAVRAVCVGLEELGDPDAAEPLAAKLSLPGICGHDCPTVESVPPMGGYGVPSDVDRSLVELSFARALLACGDWHGKGKAVYERYARDVRGFLAEHAVRTLRRFGAPNSVSVAVDAAVAKGHPRLFATADDFARLKGSLAEGSLRALTAQRIVERAEGLIETPPTERVVEGRRLLATSRKALARISTLSMAYRLSGDGRIRDRAVAELKAVCAFPDWNPSHFLDVAEMSLAVAIGYDWLYDALSEDDRRTIRDALARLGLDAGMRGGWWARAGNNWGQVCRAGMIAAALVLADDESLRGNCEKMVRESVAALPISMKAMAPDGCYPEGPGYWHYGVSFNVYAIAMLESACGTDFGLSSLPGFWKTAEYPNFVTGPVGLTMGYSDCGTGRGAMGVLWWFAQKLKRPDLPTEKEVGAWTSTMSAERADRMAATELLWMDDRKPEAFPWRAPSVWAPQGVVQIATLRSGDSFVGLKGGRPKTNHGHMDGGNFVFDMGGERWAWELSAENYNRIEQMKTVTLWSMSQESSRWSLLRLNTFGHNVPRIDGAQQCVTGCAYVVSTEGAPSPSAVMDLTTLYPAAKKVTRRAILMEDGRRFAVTDTFEGLRPGAEIVWQFVTKAKGEPNGLELLLSQEGKRLRAIRRGTNASEWSFAPAEGPKPLNAPNKGFSIASFVLHADPSGHAEARVGFALFD